MSVTEQHNSDSEVYLWVNKLFWTGTKQIFKNLPENICQLKISQNNWRDVLIIGYFDLVVFAIDFVVCRTVSQELYIKTICQNLN